MNIHYFFSFTENFRRGLQWHDFFGIIYGYIKFKFKGPKMNAKDFIKRFISRGAVIYTAGSLFVLLFSLVLPENSAAKLLAPEPFIYFAIYAYLLSFGTTVFASGAFSAPVSRLIHAVCYNVGFMCFLLFCGMTFSYTAIFTAIFAIAYTATILISAALKKKPSKRSVSDKVKEKTNTVKLTKKKSKPESTYQSRFS